MGEVFLADDLQLNRPVAIKFLVGPGDDQSRRRLLREARAVAALDHPFICTVYEVGSDPAGGDFIVMQYLEGESLATRLDRGRLSPQEALELGGRIAEALSAAHRHGIVHRDLKPQNIIITRSGAPKLLDFGLARHVTEGSASAEDVTASQLTKPHAVIGTPGYMAPEQIRSQAPDVRSDLFSLGCVLYECFTGRRAFTGANSAEIFGQVLHVEPPVPSSMTPDLQPAHDALCALLLQKPAAARFQSADEVLGAIRALLPATTARDTSRVTASRVATGRRVNRRYVIAAVVAAVLLAGAFATWYWGVRPSLPAAPPDARRWMNQSVEFLREGSFGAARAALEEAVKIFPDYAQAYARLAEACTELDDERCAQHALVRVGAIVADTTRLAPDDQLRLTAVRASVLRDHAKAIESYRAIAERGGADAGAWVDLGRAEEALGRRLAARDHYAKAVALDAQYAAAHLRLGAVQAQGGETAAGLKSIDEAIRLYRAASNVEGEAEAQLRKAVVFNNISDFASARAAVDRVVQLSADPKFLSQRVRATLELARTTSAEGRYADAEAIARDAVTDASANGLQTIAANGLIDMATTLIRKGQNEAADDQLDRAATLAAGLGATRTEMRARLQQAFIRVQRGQAAEAIALAEAPMRFFSENRYVRIEASAKNILSRAHESLEHYDEASRLATEALAFAESIDDRNLAAASLENLAGQLAVLGRLPEALTYRERIEQVHRERKDVATLSFDLANHADLLIQLGREPEAEPLLAEVDRGVASGVDAFVRRRRQVAKLRALAAAIQQRFAEVERFAAAAAPAPGEPVDDTARWAAALAEYARAQLGTSRTDTAVIATWPAAASTPAARREISYWVAQTLLARRAPAQAYAVAADAWAAPAVRGNVELRWRLAAVAAQAVRAGAAGPDGASRPARAGEDLRQLMAAWPGAAVAYLERPDLAALRRTVS
jgi:tetratricopeptide (TPR) repeat protein